MAGFATFIGGMGDEALRYGQQIRGLLEERRGHFIDVLTKIASESSDPEFRADIHKSLTGLLSNKDMGTLVQPTLQAFEKHMERSRQIAQALPPPQGEQPKLTAGPTPVGQPAGTGVSALPSTSPVQPSMQDLIALPRSRMDPILPESVAPQGQEITYRGAEPVPSKLEELRPPVQPVAPAAEVRLPDLNVQDPMAIMQKYMGHPSWEAPANRAAMTAAMNLELSRNEDVRKALEVSQANLAIGLQKLGLLADDPRVAAISEKLKAAGYPEFLIPGLVGAALGIQIPSTMGMISAMFTPIRMMNQTAASVLQRWPEEAEEAGLTPASGPVDVFVNKITGKPVSIGGRAVRNVMTPALDTQGNIVPAFISPYQAPGPVGPVGSVQPVTPAQGTPVRMPTAGGGVEQTSGAQVQAGIAPVRVSGAVAPAMQPQVTTHFTPVQATGPDGKPVTYLVPVQSTSGKVAPGGPGVPAPLPPSPTAGTAFEKPLTPEQIVRHKQQLGQYNFAIGRMQAIRGRLHLLDSMLNAGKLNLSLDASGFLRAALGRMTLTPQEAEFLGDFRTMMEDINMLRGPMGATGFRGPEAWAALQAQRGQLLADPQITRQVLDNSIQALQAQRDPLQEVLARPQQQGQANEPITIELPGGKTITIK